MDVPIGFSRLWKFKKRGWRYGVGAGLLKREEAGTFSISFFQDLSFLHIEITLPLAKFCYAFEEKSFFSPTIILWERSFEVVYKWIWKYPINQDNLFVKGFKRLKINFWMKATAELVKSPFWYLFKPKKVGMWD